MDNMTEDEFVKIVINKKEIMFRLAKGILKNDTEAEDAISEAVLTAWQKRHLVKDVNKFDAWLMRITINKAISMRHRNHREVLVAEISDDCYMTNDNNDHDGIWEYVYKLKDKYKMLIILRYYENMSIEELADITGLKVGTVKSRLHRARKMLKEMIPEYMYKHYDEEVQ